MREIKLISLDLDGTLLDSQKRLSERTRRALKECIARGIHIVPTTGRTVDGIPPFLKEIPGVRYAITTNGAVIADMKEDQVLDRRMLEYDQAAALLRIIDQYPVMYDPYMNGRGISEPKFFDHMDRYGLPKEIQELVRVTRDVVPSIIRHVEERQCPVEKINLFFGDSELRQTVRKRLMEVPGILITSSMPFNLEINHPEATKGKGILRLAARLGLTREQTMACGDGENDMSMIREAGLGVAMGNGMESLKAAADYVTETNDNDGVAAAIEYFVLGK